MARKPSEKEALYKHLAQFVEEFNIITEDDILKKDADGVWTWKGHKISIEEVAVLREEAGGFQRSALWKVLKTELRYLASKTLLERGTDVTDIRIAQVMGFMTQVIDDKLKSMLK